MTEVETIPVPDASLGGWILQTVSGPADGHGGRYDDWIDVGWSRDGSRAGYRSSSTFASMIEAKLACETMGRRMATPDGTTKSAFLEAAGFACPAPRGLSSSGNGSWQKSFGDRWFVYFGHDEMGETQLRVVDRNIPVFTQVTVGTILLPEELTRLVTWNTPIEEEALLAILSLRMGRGDPWAPVLEAGSSGD